LVPFFYVKFPGQLTPETLAENTYYERHRIANDSHRHSSGHQENPDQATKEEE
jgi:hypothetical protein